MNHNTTAPLQNVAIFNQLLDHLMNRAPHLPGMATFHGPSGYGKTMSATHGAHVHHAYYVEAGYSWSKSKFCEAVLVELGHPIKGTIATKVDKIIEVLATEGKPLIIDEFDFIVDKKIVDLVREIHDKSGTPIVMIGEELLPAKLKEWERVHNRILDFVAAQPASLEDIKILAKLHCPDVEIEEDLLKEIHKRTDGRLRRVCVTFDHIRKVSKTTNQKQITANQFSPDKIFTGQPPKRRAA